MKSSCGQGIYRIKELYTCLRCLDQCTYYLDQLIFSCWDRISWSLPLIAGICEGANSLSWDWLTRLAQAVLIGGSGKLVYWQEHAEIVMERVDFAISQLQVGHSVHRTTSFYLKYSEIMFTSSVLLLFLLHLMSYIFNMWFRLHNQLLKLYESLLNLYFT